MLLVLIVFFLSLVGIITLFVLKHVEATSGRMIAARLRTKSDDAAVRLRELIHALEADLAKVPSTATGLLRAIVQRLALGAARGARTFETQSHRLADLVSYKHRFERPAPRSEFLNKIAEHKNGNGLDTTGERGQNT